MTAELDEAALAYALAPFRALGDALHQMGAAARRAAVTLERLHGDAVNARKAARRRDIGRRKVARLMRIRDRRKARKS